MEKGDLIVHVGTAKTGTTSLHFAFYRLHSWLLENKWHYPNLNNSGFGWTAERGRSAGNADPDYPGFEWETSTRISRLAWMLRRAEETSEANCRILLSSELLSGLCTLKEFWETLSEFQEWANRKVRVVMYLRDPFSMFMSCYQQNVKIDGFYGDAGDFINDFNSNNFVTGFYTQSNIDLVHQFSKSNQISLDFYRYEDTCNQIESHFFTHVLNLEIPKGLYEPIKFNTALSTVEIDFQRGVNSFYPQLGRLLGFERTDLHLIKNVKRFKSNYLMSLTGNHVVALQSLFDSYETKVKNIVNFADRIDFTVDPSRFSSDVNPEIEQLRKEIYELGRFVALSFKHGYIDWEKRKGNI